MQTKKTMSLKKKKKHLKIKYRILFLERRTNKITLWKLNKIGGKGKKSIERLEDEAEETLEIKKESKGKRED
jgi:hypothetical protein